MTTRKFGWIRSLPDIRDVKYRVPRKCGPLPDNVDLRPKFKDIPIWDQGNIGSCTAFATAGALCYNQLQQNDPLWTPSFLFMYYNARRPINATNEDSGATIRDAIKTVAEYGAPKAELWPYDVSKYTKQPPATVYSAAQRFKIVTYAALNNKYIHHLKSCLAMGEVFVFGCMVYDSFMAAVDGDGWVPMPGKTEQALGGHALCAVGYTPTHFIIRNSWGEQTGDKGYLHIPNAFMTNTDISSDFWAVHTVTEQVPG